MTWFRSFPFSERLGAEHAWFVLDPTETFIGGFDSPTKVRHRRDKAKDFVGCINDVRFNDYLLSYTNGPGEAGYANSVGRAMFFLFLELFAHFCRIGLSGRIHRIFCHSLPRLVIPLAKKSITLLQTNHAIAH